MQTLRILYNYLVFPEIWQLVQCNSFRWGTGYVKLSEDYAPLTHKAVSAGHTH